MNFSSSPAATDDVPAAAPTILAIPCTSTTLSRRASGSFPAPLQQHVHPPLPRTRPCTTANTERHVSHASKTAQGEAAAAAAAAWAGAGAGAERRGRGGTGTRQTHTSPLTSGENKAECGGVKGAGGGVREGQVEAEAGQEGSGGKGKVGGRLEVAHDMTTRASARQLSTSTCCS